MVKKVIKLVSASKKLIKCPFALDPIGITVHNTENDATARNEIAYMSSNLKACSFHFAVDDTEIVQGISLVRNAWHAGDGANGTGNRKTIAIEICYSKSGGEKFLKAERNAAEFIGKMLVDKNWGINKVYRHKDWSGKNCPRLTMELGWDRFLKMVAEYMEIYKNGGKSTETKTTNIPVEVKSTSTAITSSVKGVQTYLNNTFSAGLVVDGCFGTKSRKAFIKALQTSLNISGAKLSVDGVWGNNTASAVSSYATVKNGSCGVYTVLLQCGLVVKGYGISIDGKFGNNTLSAVKNFQRSNELTCDGIVGKNTWASLIK